MILFFRFVIAIGLLAGAVASTASQGRRSSPRRRPQQGSASQNTARWLERIDSRADFDRLARIYYRGRFYALPHLMFVIDRSKENRVYYVNSKLYQFHKDFLNSTYLSLERGPVLFENTYLKPNRRFIVGTIAYYPAMSGFAFEFWEGDKITEQLLSTAFEAITKSFFTSVSFKPNSSDQEAAAHRIKEISTSSVIPVLTLGDLASSKEYQALNLASGIGQLRILDRVSDDTVIDRNQIVIFKETPVHLPPLSGIITVSPASPLSHINLLAKAWSIPNAYIKNAGELFKSLEGKYVKLAVRDNDYTLEPADPREVTERNMKWIKRADLVTPPADLEYANLTDLYNQRALDARRFGAKSANLGELAHARIQGITIPPGFSIPFYYYREFLRRNNLEDKIADAVEEERFVHDPAYRKSRLASIRSWIERGRFDEAFKQAILTKAHHDYEGKGLFVRSSTNAEDLKDFSGAGLYTTVPNVRTDEQLLSAIKTVWASVWNYEAYEARESFGMNHFGVFPGVLIQVGINADSAGVGITTDPFNASSKESSGTVYINAKRGLGIRVVEGQKIAEQVLYRTASKRIQVLTRSEDDTMLTFDEGGGVKEVRSEQGRAVLNDQLVRRLAAAALKIKQVFRGMDQDIEWVYAGGALYIVQSRPLAKSQP